MKEQILVGDLVKVWVNTERDQFGGRVLAKNETVDPNNHTWYKVKPISADSMPGTFWYKDNKIKPMAMEI